MLRVQKRWVPNSFEEELEEQDDLEEEAGDVHDLEEPLETARYMTPRLLVDKAL